uniref:Uncharacterized protein n=1 Tax=Amphiprion percula TaxID=161767 RepID=A0A3P8SRX6_AMPPE
MIAAPEIPSEFAYTQDTDTRFSSDTDFSEDPDGRSANSTKGKNNLFFKGFFLEHFLCSSDSEFNQGQLA